jgi:membrane protein YdbS with pleckstrin-like domain
MFEKLKGSLLVLLRIPPEPQPPSGAPGSLRVFRAAPNFFRLRLLRWAVSQVSALIGLVVALVILHGGLGDRLLERAPNLRPLEAVVLLVEGIGVIGFFCQMPVTLAATRLDYELRWYLLTDRSLRIRAGIWTVEELTMTYANIQELTVHQGPLQRLLGIADLKVRSAGGGAARQEGHTVRESHVAYFHGVDNAPAIRDLILEHLRRQRDTGLGDPDRIPDEPAPSCGASQGDLVEAAREVLIEARALKAAIEV